MPLLKPEDGAMFCARVDALGNGQFRAECWAVVSEGGVRHADEPVYFLAPTADAVHDWIETLANERGFAGICWNRPPPGRIAAMQNKSLRW